MPKNVRRFEFLMYVALTVSFALLAWAFWEGPSPQILPGLSMLSVWWSFKVFLIWRAARRRKNWARWILFVMFILETAVLAFNSAQADAEIPDVLFLIRALEGLAYYFVFTGDARPWFRKGSIGIEFCV